MKWPFVSRVMHEEIVSLISRRLAAEEEHMLVLRRQLGDLQSKYHQLILSGATPSVNNVDNTGLVARGTLLMPPERDPVLAAIEARAGGDGRKRALMLAQLGRDRAAKISDEDILKAIDEGVATDGLIS